MSCQDRPHGAASAIFWLAVGLVACYGATRLGLGSVTEPGAGFIFFWSGLILVLLSLVVVVESIRAEDMVEEIGKLTGIALGSVPARSWSQDKYPSRPIEMVVAFPAGGFADVTGRIFAEEMSKVLNTSITPINKGGATGSLAATTMLNAAKDGYSIAAKKIPTNYPTRQPARASAAATIP